MILLAGLAVLAIPLAALITAIVAHSRISDLETRLRHLSAEVARLKVRPEPRAEAESRAAPVVPPEPVKPAPILEEISSEPSPAETPAAAEIPPVFSAASKSEVAGEVERRLTGRWTIWLGAVTVALGGIFLVKYSIEEGLLSPSIRVALGLCFGLALLVLGRLSRGGIATIKVPAAKVPYVSAALIASGIVTLFAALYAAYALYALIPPLLAFGLMAGVSALAVGLSLVEGPFIAVLGLACAFLVPLLVRSNAPTVVGLFGYVLVVAGACLWLLRQRPWYWLGQVVLGFSAAWVLAWMATHWSDGDEIVLGGYLVLLAAAFLQPGRRRPESPALPHWFLSETALAWSAAGLTALLCLAVAIAARDSFAALIAVGLLASLYIAVARLDPELDRLSSVAGLLVMAVIALWRFKGGLFMPVNEAALPGPYWLPPSAVSYASVALIFALLMGGSCFALLWGAARAWFWAAVGALTPLALLTAVYWRITDVAVSLPWAAVAFGLAALFLLGARRAAFWRDQGMEPVLGIYALATAAAITLAATMSLRDAWLTVALALQIPIAAWISSKARIPRVDWLAAALALAVLVRLLVNPEVRSYEIGDGFLFNWLLYGYAIPCIALLAGARLLKDEADARILLLLKGGGLALGLAFISLEIRHFIQGSQMWGGRYAILEQGLQVSTWLGVALGLLRQSRDQEGAFHFYAWRIVGGIAAVHLLLQLTIWSPLLTGDAVGDLPILNFILVAYGFPALLTALFRIEAARQGQRQAELISGVLALVFGFVFLSLEVRQAFHGSRIDHVRIENAEAYAYSLVWLLYGCALLAIGFYRQSKALRLAALTIMTLTVAKTFLFDMSHLTGLYRAGSFFGLGLCLIGIGYLYQRMVYAQEGSAKGADQAS